MVTQVTNFGRSGLADWVIQRVSAVIMLTYFLFMAGYLISNPSVTFDQWKALFDTTWMAAFSTAALLSVVAHAWIGLWVVSTDYMTTRTLGAKGTKVRLVFQAAYSIVLFYYLVWGIKILWG